MKRPPKPEARKGSVSTLRFFQLAQKDILSALPARLYWAWMAEFRTPFFRSYLCNQPELVDLVLKQNPDAFPKSNRIREGLAPLLRNSVFVTNGEVWKKQRRIIDPAFEGGNLRDIFSAMVAAAEGAVARLKPLANGEAIETEFHTSHTAADVIFRTLFSIPIEHEQASRVFHEFQAHQRMQPVLNLGALVPLPRWFPRFHRRKTHSTAQNIRALIEAFVQERQTQIEDGTAPNDLATKIMTTADPVTGDRFEVEEMIDQIAIFFLAGHETSASALAWALYLLALFPDWQEKVEQECATVIPSGGPSFSDISKLRITRDVFREALRLYSPVPMMVREATCPHQFRDRQVPKGAQIVLSPWHLHRHERLWDNPDDFDPARFGTENGKACLRTAYMPFSAGQRVCPGAGFAMIEGQLLLAMLVKAYRFEVVEGREPVPVAHLTVRSKDGIWLKVTPRVG
ncbi:Epi-isozizaene 5-monooxygenase/(E)-beta-farnesene synthase [Roseovarius albus]|uniref:Epi-isozizaene 5-monooxygenase/(E)-beta-farnesene synthase n=1 Tax=Roseovarius albus TaxID=1247867 RepID=A0A1X6YCN3_9RHOB|nr:cytochrome P450 [Roseovarius albus]SLN17159.1 Epi-isozizaene 5-monooxygenase/(E)-beta-farnesene synthase [Roseovarius albus]